MNEQVAEAVQRQQGAAAVPVWFEDYAPGLTIVSPSRVVAEDDVRAYVRFSNDVRPVLNAPSEAGLPIPNLYLFCLGVGLLLHGRGGYIPEEFVAFFGFDSITFHRQAQAGQTIRSTAIVTEVIPRSSTGLVVYRHETHLESGEPLVSSEQRILVRKRGSND